jgi:hypothetical protein
LKLLDFGLCKEAVDGKLLGEDVLQNLKREAGSDCILVNDDDEKMEVGKYLDEVQVRKWKLGSTWMRCKRGEIVI